MNHAMTRGMNTLLATCRTEQRTTAERKPKNPRRVFMTKISAPNFYENVNADNYSAKKNSRPVFQEQESKDA